MYYIYYINKDTTGTHNKSYFFRLFFVTHYIIYILYTIRSVPSRPVRRRFCLCIGVAVCLFLFGVLWRVLLLCCYVWLFVCLCLFVAVVCRCCLSLLFVAVVCRCCLLLLFVAVVCSGWCSVWCAICLLPVKCPVKCCLSVCLLMCHIFGSLIC